MTTSNKKTISELFKLPSFELRLEYLRVENHMLFDQTFGSLRDLNQKLYTSKGWRDIRRYVILRDNGCDLAIPGREIAEKPIIHHINPITVDDILNRTNSVLDPENLITTTHRTHTLIHYGGDAHVDGWSEREKDDTQLWPKTS